MLLMNWSSGTMLCTKSFAGSVNWERGWFYLYLFGKMHERTGTLQGGVPEGIQFVTFRTGGFNSLVGYFQAAVAVLHLPQGITEAKGKGGLCGHSTDGKQHAGSSRKESPA